MTHVTTSPSPLAGQPGILAVDLDGTLLRSNILYESFWSAFGRNWISPFRATLALAGGRASLKRHLADAAEIDVANLPYDADVIDYVRNWRAQGGRTALVTASTQPIAEDVAAHLDLFDEVHGSSASRNLKGAVKAAFLTERFGAGGYAYIGDAPADLPVWQQASCAVTVNAGATLRKQAEAVAPEIEHLTTHKPRGRDYLRALRPHQWLKNILVFLPMLAAHQLDAGTIIQSMLAFICFSLIASSVYVVNDLLDLNADRAHPRKRFRPFAAGSIPIEHGSALALGLLLAGGALALPLGPGFLAVVALYYVLTTAYSLHFKRRIVEDICLLAGLYTIRTVAGGAATGIPLSVWLLAFSIFFFFSLAAVKRQAELVDSAKRQKLTAQGRGYHVDDLPIISMIAIASGYVSVLVLALYVNSPAVAGLYASPQGLWGICCVLLYWVTRTVMLAHRGQMQDDPVVYAARDRSSQLCFLIVLSFAVWSSAL